MTTYLMNTLPNILWQQGGGRIDQITANNAAAILRRKEGYVSVVGHQSTATLYSQILDIPIQMNRVSVQVKPGDVIVAGLFTPTRRLAEGEIWTIEEMEAMPINWVGVLIG